MGFPEQLKKARLSAGYTQQQVADSMGVTNSTYCGYETGKRQPDVAKIKQLSKILNTSGDFLLETGFIPIAYSRNGSCKTSKTEPKTDLIVSTKDTILVFEKLNVGNKIIVKSLMEQLLELQKKQNDD